MAVITKINNSRPYNAKMAVVGGGPNPPTEIDPTIVWAGEDARVNAIDAVLDTRFDTGGTTTWERPGQA